MTERWKQELMKLRGAPELPEDLWAGMRAGRRMTVPPPSRRRATIIAVAFTVVIPVFVFAWIALRPLHGAQISSLDVLVVPPTGQVAPANLAGGRPVFVVHHTDGTVSVVDGFSTHVVFGMAKVNAWCPASRTFFDPFHGSEWTERGFFLAGPAPTGLVTYHTTMLPDGRVRVGPPIRPSPRGAGGSFQPVGPFCQSLAGTVRPTLPTRVFTSPSALVDASPAGWVAVKGVLADVGGRAELCSSFSSVSAACPDSAQVDGLDVVKLFRESSASFPGTYIGRVESGALVELTRWPVPGCCSS
jgi:hypothetical protein